MEEVFNTKDLPRESTLSQAHEGLHIIVPEKASRPVKLRDVFKVMRDVFRIKVDMLSPFPGKYPLAASISHCQIEDNDPLRFFVCDRQFGWYFGSRLWHIRTIINPKITWKSETTEKSHEGCMSFPFQKTISLRRHTIVEMKYWTFFGPRTKKFYEFRSFMCQHEIDHMNNMTIVDKWKHKLKKKHGKI